MAPSKTATDPGRPLSDIIYVSTEPLNDSSQNEKDNEHLDGDGGSGTNHSVRGIRNGEEPMLADPSSIRLGKYNIPPSVSGPVGALLIAVVALLLTFTTPAVNANPKPWNIISSCIGWVYFLAWGVSFLPQLYFNMRRGSVVGQSFEFVCLNILGFTCYAVYTLCFYSNDAVKHMYQDRYNGSSNTVALNDVVFAVYALACCLVNGVQIIFLDRGSQTLSLIVAVLIGVVCFVVILWVCIIAGGVRSTVVFNYLDLLYGLSTIKLGTSVVKYLPQLYLNYKRKCTIGWNICNVLLDFTGGTLSILQQVIDSAVTGNWVGMTGNPVKFALGSVSLLYDIVFFVQHFVLYAENNRRRALPEHGAVQEVFPPAGEDKNERPNV
ncbi:cystinosin [Trypanosoma rangeli]|uniref:Cystinosin n=1 Tax=Trypanosoma rangeli TaxID=5698 RepID=A0A3R7JXN2_TRYRA|nr:cystinosin [Trypanosoma rangeli]RNE97103.1 cystinosin [Trypanosoma rangeli]|eukprot:RNE97103.1 cystinosin [Trypanosoma rangeli]